MIEIKKDFVIPYEVAKDLCITYARHIASMRFYLECLNDDYHASEECAEWMYDEGYKYGMEAWLKVIGVNPDSPFIQMMIKIEKEKIEYEVDNDW